MFYLDGLLVLIVLTNVLCSTMVASHTCTITALGSNNATFLGGVKLQEKGIRQAKAAYFIAIDLFVLCHGNYLVAKLILFGFVAAYKN